LACLKTANTTKALGNQSKNPGLRKLQPSHPLIAIYCFMVALIGLELIDINQNILNDPSI
jgi:hypothetical protein